MKNILLILLLLFSSAIQAATYYVSSVGNTNNSGLTTSETWNLTKVNSFTFSAGDQVLLMRGDVFQGNISLTESGAIGSPITIGSYGTGAKPVISGLVSVSAWTNLGSNIWESTNTVSSQPSVEMLTVNGTNSVMGRYPNADAVNGGFLTFQSHSGTTSITSSSLTGTPNWTGAEMIIKGNMWTEYKRTITGQTSGTISFDALSVTPIDGYGFFIQNDARTLDKQNEWYFNPSTKKLKIYSTAQPTGVKVCADDTLMLISGNYITVDNISVTGANTKGIYVYKYNATPHHITIQNCDVSYSGGTAIYCRGNYISVEGNTITASNRCAIDIDSCPISSIRNNEITDTYIFHKETRHGAIMAQSSVTSTIIEYNRIVNSGSNAINVETDSLMLVKNNYIDAFNTITADAGAIYLGGAGSYPMTITGNVILNGIGNCFGTTDSTQSGSRGLYLDDNCLNMEVSYNSIANVGSHGIMIHNSSSINIHHNTVYNCSDGHILFSNNADHALMTGNVTQNNIFIAKESDQPTLYLASQYNNLATIGTFDNNYYARPIDDNLTIKTSPQFSASYKTLAQWQAYSSQDANSHKSPVSISNVSDFRFIYNDTNASKIIGIAKPMVDVTGTKYVTSVYLPAFTSKVLIVDPSPAASTNPSNKKSVLKTGSKYYRNHVTGKFFVR